MDSKRYDVIKQMVDSYELKLSNVSKPVAIAYLRGVVAGVNVSELVKWHIDELGGYAKIEQDRNRYEFFTCAHNKLR